MPNPSITQATRAPAATGANGAVAAPDASSAAVVMLRQYWPKLRALLPTHINTDAWYGQVIAALYRGQDPSKDLDLMRAANINPESLIFALYDAAQQGLRPGTPEYYLTPRPNRAAKGKCEVLGMRGYQGEIELIYRAGAVSSVVVEIVRMGGPKSDFYQYRRGIDQFPVHNYDPWARKADRGEKVGVYAYAIMADSGMPSRILELNIDDIERAKRASPSAGKSKAFWDDPDDEDAMWIKTGVHRLSKFVPTSAEILHVRAGAMANAAAAAQVHGRVQERQLSRAQGVVEGDERAALPAQQPGRNRVIDVPATGDQLDPTQFRQPPAPEDDVDAMAAEAAADAAPRDIGELELFVSTAPESTGGAANQGQHRAIMRLLGKHLAGDGAAQDAHRHAVFSTILGRAITSGKDLQTSDASYIHDVLSRWARADEIATRVGAMDPARAATQPAAGDAPAEHPGDTQPAPTQDAPSKAEQEIGTRPWHETGHPRLVDGKWVRRGIDLETGDCGICEQDAATLAEARAADESTDEPAGDQS